MAKSPTGQELVNLIKSLRAERQAHLDEIAKIERIFDSYGIPVEEAGRGRRGGKARRGKAAGRRGKRKRGSFKLSGEESVLKFVARTKNPSTADVNKHWKKEGRGGKADNTLTKLVQEGRLKRAKKKGERGSRYSVA